MAEYIEREAALKECDWYANEFCECEYAIMPLKGALENLPAANVRPVVRGKWEWNKNNGFYYCSKCGAISPREDQDGEYCDCPNYCYHCGADMRPTSMSGANGEES